MPDGVRALDDEALIAHIQELATRHPRPAELDVALEELFRRIRAEAPPERRGFDTAGVLNPPSLRGMRRLVILAVAAAAVGGCGSDSRSSGGGGGAVSTKDVTLPATIGSFKDVGDASAARADGNQQAVNSVQSRQATIKKLTIERYRKAYDGAAVDYRGYASSDIQTLVSIIAIRADAPGLTFGPVSDAKSLGLAKPQDEIADVGDVECRVRWDPIPEGQAVSDDKEHILACQKSQNGLTVQVQGSPFDGKDGLDQIAKLTSDAYDAVA